MEAKPERRGKGLLCKVKINCKNDIVYSVAVERKDLQGKKIETLSVLFSEFVPAEPGGPGVQGVLITTVLVQIGEQLRFFIASGSKSRDIRETCPLILLHLFIQLFH